MRRGLRRYETAYNERFLQNMRSKLGLIIEAETDMSLVMDTFGMMHEHHIDYTAFFRALSNLHSHGHGPVQDLFADRSVADQWLERYEERITNETRSHDKREHAMRRVNPKYVLRSYLAQQVIQEAQNGDYEPMKALLKLSLIHI